MAEQADDLEQQVEAMIFSGFAQSGGNRQDAASQDGTGERNVIDVDLYRLEGGAVLLVPNNGANPLDESAIDSQPPTPREQEAPPTGTPGAPPDDEEPQEEEHPQDVQPEFIATGTRRGRQPSFALIPLALLCLLAAGAASYWCLLPLTATASVTITPTVKSLHAATAFTIAESPKAGQVQGRPLAAISLTRSQTVPATGHAHDDATAAAGIITFYNADSSPYTIPAGVSFTVQGVTVATEESVTVQAAIPPSFGMAIAAARAMQAGSAGNIAAHSVYARCCGSAFITATNAAPFTGGQDARDYSYIQNSDIQNAATGLLSGLTPRATAALSREARPGEQLVAPLCSPRTVSGEEAGTAAASVTVSVTETCSGVAYRTDSLNQVATSALAESGNLANYQEEGTVQVAVNGSTYTNHTALLKVSLSGVWLYRFTQAELTRLKTLIAGKGTKEAEALLAKAQGIRQASVHLQRLDFKDLLPADASRISIQFFYVVS